MIDIWYDFMGAGASDVTVSSAAGYCNDIVCVSAIAFTVCFAVICIAILFMVGARR